MSNDKDFLALIVEKLSKGVDRLDEINRRLVFSLLLSNTIWGIVFCIMIINYFSQ